MENIFKPQRLRCLFTNRILRLRKKSSKYPPASAKLTNVTRYLGRHVKHRQFPYKLRSLSKLFRCRRASDFYHCIENNHISYTNKASRDETEYVCSVLHHIQSGIHLQITIILSVIKNSGNLFHYLYCTLSFPYIYLKILHKTFIETQPATFRLLPYSANHKSPRTQMHNLIQTLQTYIVPNNSSARIYYLIYYQKKLYIFLFVYYLYI